MAGAEVASGELMKEKEAVKPAAQLDWSLYVECPKCQHYFDLGDDDPDYCVSKSIFNNDWGALKDYETECPSCGFEFQISGAEY